MARDHSSLPPLEFKQYSVDDYDTWAPALAALYVQTMEPDEGRYIAEGYVSRAPEPSESPHGALHYGLHHEGQLIAGGSLGKEQEYFFPNGLLLRRLAVVPDWRRRGVGRYMMGLLEQEAVKRGYETLSLIPYDDVIPFYVECGYHPEDPQETGRYVKHLSE